MVKYNLTIVCRVEYQYIFKHLYLDVYSAVQCSLVQVSAMMCHFCCHDLDNTIINENLRESIDIYGRSKEICKHLRK